MGRNNYFNMSIEFTKQEISQMESNLSAFFKSKNITLEVPVDIFELTDNLGFDVRGTEFSSSQLDGLLLVNENLKYIDNFESNKVIAYDCKKSINQKKFIVAHELAHYIEEKINNMSKKIIVAARDRDVYYPENKSEQMKDYYAAAILMPKNDMIANYSKSDIQETDDFYNSVATRYRVDLDMAKRRIKEVFYE